MALITNCNKITNCDSRVSWFFTNCNCHNLWGFKTQFLRLISKLHGGILPRTFKRWHCTWVLFPRDSLVLRFGKSSTNIHIHMRIYPSNNAKMGKNATTCPHDKSAQGSFAKYTEHVFGLIRLNLPRHGLDLNLRQNHNLLRWSFRICRNLWLSQFAVVQSTTSQIDVKRALGYTPKYLKDVHIYIGHFPEGFIGTSIGTICGFCNSWGFKT